MYTNLGRGGICFTWFDCPNRLKQREFEVGGWGKILERGAFGINMSLCGGVLTESYF